MITFYNTLTKQKEQFKPQEEGVVKIYSCGPTVYNRVHIGNLRGFSFADLLRRYFVYKGFKVIHIMNLTDVDDKTIRDSQAAGMPLREFTDRYIDLFFADIKTLNIEKVTHYPRATDHITEMLDLIQQLMDKGFAYSKGDSVYFKLEKMNDYGKLSGHKPTLHQLFGSRIDADEYDKDDVRDFVLWKGYKEGEPYWDTPFGKGRPGWHIECSAMSMKYLGEHFDIHTGGVDLVFPHHENEIAQSEGATGKPFVSYWLHNEFLVMDADKMSKSLGNVLYLQDLLDKNIDPMVIRYFLISTHYRKIIRYTDETLEAAGNSLNRLRDFVTRLEDYRSPDLQKDSLSEETMKRWSDSFEAALDDDLNIAQALAVFFEAVKELNSSLDQAALTDFDKQRVMTMIDRFDSVLGLKLLEKENILSESLLDLIAERDHARDEKNWSRADEIRDLLLAEGIALEDSPQGTRWKKVSPVLSPKK